MQIYNKLEINWGENRFHDCHTSKRVKALKEIEITVKSIVNSKVNSNSQSKVK
jgi:hypothetical protein